MKKNLFLTTYILAFAALSFTAKSQSIVDPGISVHNYKHPNKAAQAKSNATVIKVESYNTVERLGKNQQSKFTSSTPKYAPRPARLVMVREYKIEGVDINPLISPRNYKTPNPFVPKDTSEIADYNPSIYPTRD